MNNSSANNALIIIDYINEIASPEGKLGALKGYAAYSAVWCGSGAQSADRPCRA